MLNMAPICKTPGADAVGSAWACRRPAAKPTRQIVRRSRDILRRVRESSTIFLKIKKLLILLSLFKVRFLLWRLVNVVVDAYGVLNSVACRSDRDRIGVVKVAAAATCHRSDRSEGEEKQGRVGDDAGQFSGRATGVTQAQKRQQE